MIGNVWAMMIGIGIGIIITYYIIRKIEKDNQAVYLNGSVMIAAVVLMACFCLAVIFQRQLDTKTSQGDLLSMQSITLTITATAVSLMTIIHALQNYDREKKDKLLEENLQKEFKKKTDEFELKEIELNKAIAEFKTMRDELKSSIFVLFDSNTDDEAYLNVRLVNNKALYEKESTNINVALAYIDALVRCSKQEESKEKFAKNKLICDIADSMLEKRPDMSPLQKISFKIKKAKACYDNGRLIVDFNDEEKKKQALELFGNAYTIFEELLSANDTPRELDGYLEGQLGLCSFWQYKATREKQTEYLDNSKKHYDNCQNKESTKTDIRMLNSRIVSKHNQARKNSDKEKKILQLNEVLEDYKNLIKIDPAHQKTWLNVASTDADIVHTLLDIDIRETDYEIHRIDHDTADAIRKYCDEGFDHLETAMMFNPGFFDLYYKYADLACCKSLISGIEERGKWLNDAERKLSVAEQIKKGSAQVQSVNNLRKKCSEYFEDHSDAAEN